MLKVYTIEVLKEFEFFRIGDIKNLFENDYKRVLSLYPNNFKLIKEGVLKW